jgi:hypothetical protein
MNGAQGARPGDRLQAIYCSNRCTHVKGQDKSVASGFISCRHAPLLLLHRPHRKLLLARVQRMLQQRTLQGAATH